MRPSRRWIAPTILPSRLLQLMLFVVSLVFVTVASMPSAMALSSYCVSVNADWGQARTFLPNSNAPLPNTYGPGFSASEKLSVFATTIGSTTDELFEIGPAADQSASLYIAGYLGGGKTFKPSGGLEVSVAGEIVALQATETYDIGANGSLDAGVSNGRIVVRLVCYGDAPVVGSLSRSSGSVLGNTSITLTGTSFTGVSAVSFGGVAAAAFTVDSDTQITVTSPAHAAGAVNIVVTSLGGSSATAAGNAFTYAAVPVVTALAPVNGPIAGGTSVVITGTDLTNPVNVYFGATVAAVVVANSPTQITATSPALTAGSVDVTVMTAGGTSATGAASKFTYTGQPTITAISPVKGPTGGTGNVVITGSDFVDVTSVRFGLANASFQRDSDNQITAVAPAGSAGSVSVTVTAAGGGSSGGNNQYTYVAAPTLAGLSPAQGPVSGATSVIISGTNLSDATEVRFGSALASITANSSTQITATSPPASAGAVQVTVTTAGGTSTTGGGSEYSYLEVPVISSISATQGPLGGGDVIAIIGTGLANATAVQFGASGSVIGSNTDTQITVTVPASVTPGTVQIGVTTSGGSSQSGPSSAYTYLAVPTVGAISPTQGPAAGGTLVTINGTGFTSTASVSFGSTSAATVTYVSATEISATSPGGASGTVDVRVETIGGTSATGVAGRFAYVTAPVTAGSTLTVAANSSANIVTLSMTGDTPTSVSAGQSPTHGTLTPAGLSFTYEPVAGYSGSDSFTYTATNAGGTSSAATVSITVTAPTLVVSPASGVLAAGRVNSIYSQIFTASAGTPPYAFTVTAGAVPTGLQLLPSGTLSGTPTAAVQASFTVTVTDGNGAIGTAAYTLAIAEQPPIANPVIATVVRGSVANPITLNLVGGPATFVTVDTGPTNGTATASGTAITYSPFAGHVGGDSFTYTATNPSGTSAPATVSITVTNPVLVFSPSAGSLPDATTGTNYGQTLSVSGGTAPYTYAVSGGSLPADIVLDAASGSLSGIAVSPGNYAVSITATDASGATGSANYSLHVLPSALVLSPSSGTVLPAATFGVPYAYAGISASGGSGATVFSAIGLPSGLSVSAGGSITGTPASAGSYSVDVTATDIAGATATATYALVVSASSGGFAFSPAGGALPEAMVGEAYSQDISAAGGTAPLIYSLAGGTLPGGLVLNISNGDLNGPLAANVAPGSYSFTIAVRDAAASTGSVTFTLVVQARAVTVANKDVIVPPGGTPPNVYLNAGATGGPFVDASLGVVSPASAGTAEIIRGELAQAGLVAPSGFYLRFTPNPGFSGRATVAYRLISALGTSNLGTVTYSLNFNAAAVAEEIDGMVHDFVRTRQNLLSSSIKVPGLLERRRSQNARDPVTIRMSPGREGMRAGFSTSLAQMQASRDAADGLGGDEMRPFNIWIDGALLIHGRGDNDEKDDRWGSFALLSAGMDYLLTDHVLIGISAHFDRMTDPMDEDAELKGTGWFAGPYASLEIAKGVFLDTSFLYGGSSNDIDTRFFDGKFDTTRWMWDGSIKGEWYIDDVTVVTPKLRAVYLTETVRDYAVSNDAGDRLLLEGFSMEQLRASIGAEIERTIVLSNGMVLSPHLGLTVGIAGLDGDGMFATVTAGASLQTETAWAFDFALLFDVESEGDLGLGARARASARF